MGKHTRFLPFTLLVAVFALAVSCKEDKLAQDFTSGQADSLIFEAGVQKNYDYMVSLVDSLERVGSISVMNADRWRGTAYYRQGQYRSAEFYYKKVMDGVIETTQDSLAYVKSARRLSELLLIKGDYEGSLRVAMPAVQKLQESGYGSDIDYAILINNIGCCQLYLGYDDEAKESFATARSHYKNRWQTDSTSRGYQEAVLGTVYTSQAYINTRNFAEAAQWIDRTDSLLTLYHEMPDARLEYFDEYRGRVYIMKAVALQGLGNLAEAAKAYQSFLTTEFSKTSSALIYANDYLMAAGRYKEAADNYQNLDKMLTEHGMRESLDIIQLFLLPKFRANAWALRRDSAVAVGMHLCDALDSAIVKNKTNDAAELATIYETQQKEAQIAMQQANMARHRMFSSLVALALVIISFSIIIFFRIRSAKRLKNAHRQLEEAHQKLQVAYDQLEETTAAKERIESELRIARDIQMSMVPQHAPERQGLDLHASMITAKEVGGDLYGYLLEGDSLYFCVGDVSGKGVPASLFMAQATRLFRTMASQHMMPAEIATRMNAALTENNEQGMFVTMFMGLLNLKTGKLNFCNAGHNPPLVMDSPLSAVTARNYPFRYLEMEPNAPIGLWPELEFVGEEIENLKGRPMVFYTDGLTEAENKQQEQFGEERLLDLLCHNALSSARDVDAFLKREVEKFRDGAEINDDMTLLCMLIE
jgi:serine phosphatase RsbU (regulator of sigma subunit)